MSKIATSMTKDQILARIAEELKTKQEEFRRRTNDALARVELRVSAWGWNVFDAEWPGGNDRGWFGYTSRLMLVGSQLSTVAVLDVKISFDNGH